MNIVIVCIFKVLEHLLFQILLYITKLNELTSLTPNKGDHDASIVYQLVNIL